MKVQNSTRERQKSTALNIKHFQKQVSNENITDSSNKPGNGVVVMEESAEGRVEQERNDCLEKDSEWERVKKMA